MNNAVRDANELVGRFKGKVLSAVDWTKSLGINIDKWGVKFNFNAYNQIVKPAMDAISGSVSSAINGVGNTLRDITNWLEPRTQKAVAAIVDALLGDKTGHLWNKINKVDEKIAATKTSLERVIEAARRAIRDVVRNIEILLTDPEERRRVLQSLWNRGFQTANEAYNFAKSELPKVRKQKAQEIKEAFEAAKKLFADKVRKMADDILNGSPKQEFEANLRLDKIIKGVGDIRGGYKLEFAKEQKNIDINGDGANDPHYTVTTQPSIGIGLSAGTETGGEFEAGSKSGNAKIEIAGKQIKTNFEGSVGGDIVLDTKVKYSFNYHSDEDMARLGVWAFQEIPTPFDAVDPLLEALILQNYESTEVSLNPYLTGELSKSWDGIGAPGKNSFGVKSNGNLSGINSFGVKSNGNSYRTIGMAFDAEGGYTLGDNVQVNPGEGLFTGKLAIKTEYKFTQVESIDIEIDTIPWAASSLASRFGIDGFSQKVDSFNQEVKSSGKAVSNIKFKLSVKEPMKLLNSYASLLEDVLSLSQPSATNINSKINALLQALYQTNRAVNLTIQADASQSIYINAGATIKKVGGIVGVKNTSTQEKLLYQN